MRLADLIDALVEEPSSIRDETRSGFSITGLVGTIPFDPEGEIVIVDAGDASAYPSTTETLERLAALPPSTPAIVLLDATVDRAPIVEIGGWAGQSGASIAGFIPLRYRWFRSGVALTTGDGVPGSAAQQAANERALFVPAMRAGLQENARLRHRVTMMQRQLNAQDREADALGELRAQLRARDELLRTKQSDLDTQTARADDLADKVTRLSTQVARTEFEAERVLRSTSYRLGSTLRRAARPSKRTLALPRDLYRLYANRGGWASERFDAPTAKQPASVAGVAPAPQERLYAAYRRLPTHAASIIAFIGTTDAATELDSAAEVISLWPNDATLLFDRCDPDIVLIESAAAAMGNTWFGLGRAGGADRDLTAKAILDEARERGIPSVFWWNTPVSDAPALTRVAALADLTVSDRSVKGTPEAPGFTLGADLARFHPPASADRRREAPPIAVRTGPTATPIELLLEHKGELLGDIRADSSDLAGLARADAPHRFATAAWALALGHGSLSSRDLELAASGAALIDTVGRVPGPRIELARDSDLDDAVRAHDQAMLEPESVRGLLGELAVDWSSARRLADLFVQVNRTFRGRVPIELGAIIDTDKASEDAVRGILRQEHPFVEVAVADPSVRERHRAELEAAGLSVIDHPTRPSAVLTGTDVGPALSRHLIAVSAWAAGAPVNDTAGRPVVTGNAEPARRVPWWAEEVRP
jgi:hypothetical protein